MLYVTIAISLATSVDIAPIVSKEDEAVVEDVVMVKDVVEVEELVEVDVVRDAVGVALGRMHGRGLHQQRVSFRLRSLEQFQENSKQQQALKLLTTFKNLVYVEPSTNCTG